MKGAKPVCHISNMLKAQKRKKHISFHTPGHKKRGADITELAYSDNLSSPKGCIFRAQEDIANILGASASFILTDGSTSGVLSILHAAKRAGVCSVAFFVGAHKSVWNGCKLLGLTPLMLYTPPSKESLTGEDFCLFSRADALLLTSPDYYGHIPDLTAIKSLCQEMGKLLLIDGAHGGHLHFDKTLYAGTYADLWVDGVHKSLPAQTQGAVVSARTEQLAEYLRESVDIFRTTSPSYPIMSSVEYAVKYPRNEKIELAVRKGVKIRSRLELNEDYTKLCARFFTCAFEAETFFIEQGIYPEFCDGERILFYLSPATKKKELKRLFRALDKAFERFPKTEEKQPERNPAPHIFPIKGEKEWVELDKSEGRICAENCGLFPPCTPLILAGEKVEKEKIELLKKADNAFGVYAKKILVIKEEK